MSFFLSANDQRVTAASVWIPYYGTPVADLVLASDQELADPVQIVTANLAMKTAVLRQRAFGGSLSVRLVGGAGGWGRAVAAQAYHDPAGLRLSTVLGDVARDVGESVRIDTDRVIGQWYAREAGPAQRALRQLAGSLWWMDLTGVTWVGARPSTTITTPATLQEVRGAAGWFKVATEDVGAWQPGASFTGPTVPAGFTVGAVRLTVGSDARLRLLALSIDALPAADFRAVTPADRAMSALRTIIRAEDPGRVESSVWEYQVERADEATFDGSPTSADFPLPALVGVPYRGSIAGSSCVPVQGTLAYVAFANADPTRPVLVAFGPTTPERVRIDATDEILAGAGAGRVVREGDTIALSVTGSGVVTITSGTAETPPAKSRLFG